MPDRAREPRRLHDAPPDRAPSGDAAAPPCPAELHSRSGARPRPHRSRRSNAATTRPMSSSCGRCRSPPGSTRTPRRRRRRSRQRCCRRGRRSRRSRSAASRLPGLPATTRCREARWASASSATPPWRRGTHRPCSGSSGSPILDWDVHHGNGTQDVFWDDPTVLVVSLHQWPFYPGQRRPERAGGYDRERAHVGRFR